MNSTIQIIKNRRSCKAFTNEKLPSSLVDEILKCGTYAPSALNKQSASIICLENDEIVENLRKSLIEFVGKDPFYGARTIVLVVADSNTKCPIQDASCVLENMFIAATSLGIGSCWINCLHDYFATEEGHEFKKNVLNLPHNMITVGTCVLGYKQDVELVDKPRKDDYIRKI